MNVDNCSMNILLPRKAHQDLRDVASLNAGTPHCVDEVSTRLKCVHKYLSTRQVLSAVKGQIATLLSCHTGDEFLEIREVVRLQISLFLEQLRSVCDVAQLESPHECEPTSVNLLGSPGSPAVDDIFGEIMLECESIPSTPCPDISGLHSFTTDQAVLDTTVEVVRTELRLCDVSAQFLQTRRFLSYNNKN